MNAVRIHAYGGTDTLANEQIERGHVRGKIVLQIVEE